MKTYKVTIDFKGAPSVSVDVLAISEAFAKKLALSDARRMGWTAPVKKSVAVEVVEVAA